MSKTAWNHHTTAGAFRLAKVAQRRGGGLMMDDDDRIATDLKIKMLESKLAELKGQGKGRGQGAGGKSSAFKPPKAGKVPGGKGGGGGKVSIKTKGSGKVKAAPKTPEAKPVSAQQRSLAGMGKDADASRRFLPAPRFTGC
jgi:hypothetical protein